jgi:hypothetical protein
MYKRNKTPITSIEVNNGFEGETLEEKIERIVNNREPIKDGAPLLYTERKEGVRPEHDIRSDRWDIAIDMSDAVSKDTVAKRTKMEVIKNDKVEPTQGSEGNAEASAN